jgi:L,D-peptidoglycan transpeptidase YkuD (ErfK/YbiS/YcfS/YnhG family)
MIFSAFSDGWFDLGGERVRCALGKGGVVAQADKREGDGASPLGVWPIRRALYRPDRSGAPETALSVQPLGPNDGWCDEPSDPAYNLPIQHPYPTSAERLWREDGLYDYVVVLGHNDAPVIPGAGSAIFLHVARPGYAATEGCVALAREDMEALLKLARPGDAVEIRRA